MMFTRISNRFGTIGLVLLLISHSFMVTSARADTAKDIEVVATEFSFSPTTIKLATGQRLRLTLANNGVLSHNLTFKDREIATETIQGNNKTTILAAFNEPGRYEFICSVPGHAGAGMTGVVIVE